MHYYPSMLFAISIVCFFVFVKAEQTNDGQQLNLVPMAESVRESETPHTRSKRTLFLKKKLIAGAGLLGLGVGIAKGFDLFIHFIHTLLSFAA